MIFPMDEMCMKDTDTVVFCCEDKWSAYSQHQQQQNVIPNANYPLILILWIIQCLAF